jgi:holo-[acyl-carrier protein] synthase
VILGTGIDMIEIERVASSIERYGSRFLRRIYTPGEIAYCQRKRHNAAESFAARFAAKEATAKALGTGIGFGVTWSEIEVGREPAGRPILLLHGRAAEIAGAMGVDNSSLSITHTRTASMAMVILEGEASATAASGGSSNAR